MAHTWCPIGTVTSAGSAITALYPGPDPPTTTVATEGGDDQPVQSDVLTATTDGNHILGAASRPGGAITLSDIAVTVPTTACPSSTIGHNADTVAARDPARLHALHAVHRCCQVPPPINQIIASPVSNLAFITYNGTSTGAQLPFYVPAAMAAPGTVGYVHADRRLGHYRARWQAPLPPTTPSSLFPPRATTRSTTSASPQTLR